MKKIITGIIILIVIAFFILKNESFSSHSQSNKQINYEKATKVIYANLLKNNNIRPTSVSLLQHKG